MKILVLSCKTGLGHDMAGEIVKLELEKRGHQCVMRDALAFKSKQRAESASNLYRDLTGYAPAIFGFVYYLGVGWDKWGALSPVYLANRDFGDNLYKYMRRKKFDAVISMHLFPMEGLRYIRNKYDCRTLFCGVQTDYECIPFLAESRMDSYFVPSQRVKYQLIRRGIPPNEVFVTGIPIRDVFYKKIAKKSARKQLGIDMKSQMYLLIPGGSPSHKCVKLCRLLLKNADPATKVIVVAGNNERLKSILKRKFSKYPQVEILDYMDNENVRLYMTAADVLLAKPGGLATTENAMVGTLLIHTMAIPGVEKINARWFNKKGMSIYVPKLKDAARIAKTEINNQKTVRRMIANQKRYLVRDSAAKIVDVIEGQIKNGQN